MIEEEAHAVALGDYEWYKGDQPDPLGCHGSAEEESESFYMNRKRIEEEAHVVA